MEGKKLTKQQSKDPFEAAFEEEQQQQQQHQDDDYDSPPASPAPPPSPPLPNIISNSESIPNPPPEENDDGDDDNTVLPVVISGDPSSSSSLSAVPPTSTAPSLPSSSRGAHKTHRDYNEEEEEEEHMEVELDKFPSSADPDKMAKMQAILSQFTEEQMSRYESFRRAGFQKSNMKRLLTSITGTQKISIPMTIVVSGIAKIFVGELVETALIKHFQTELVFLDLQIKNPWRYFSLLLLKDSLQTCEALKKIKLPWGVKGKLQKLNHAIFNIKAVLLDAEDKQANEEVRLLLAKLEDAVLHADNLVDEYRYEELHRKVVCGKKKAKKVRIFFSSSNHIIFRVKIASKMEEIRKTLEEIKTNRTFHLCEKVEEAPLSPILRMRETHSFVRNDEVIGRDDDEKAILKLLLDDTETIENVSLIALVGIGGLGKTTLAQFVFNDEEVQKSFDLKIWVYVSKEFDVKLIVRKVIKSITGESLEENPDLEKLQKRVREEIKGKRFMLVLDDVWNEDAEKWHKLEILLEGGASGSRVLITTRSEMVAKITGASRFHKLSGLDRENSLTLFQKTAFLKGKEPMVNSEVAKIGEDIVDKCKGVPLAIKTIGGLLFKRLVCSNDPRKVLMGFKQNELSKIANQNESDSGILPTLKLSYNNLPSHLKRCFVYCGLFPKGFDIQVQTLINQWIAHEFVKPQDNNYRSCLEDLGYNYFMELLMGSFFQEPKEDILGTIHSCKMHDLMHDLAISIAGKGIITLDESSCNYVEMDSTKLDGHGESSFGRALHMFVDFNSLGSCQIPPALLDQKKMRTFISPNSETLRSSDCDAFLLNFKSLRTFMLRSVYDKKMPKGLGDLKHLRYLDLSGYCNITTLPNSITRLYNLQTLILLGCSNLKSLPQGLQNLIKLRHLKIEGSFLLDHMPRGIGELTSLHTLDLFLVGGNNKVVSKQSGGLGELCKLNNLHGHLTIKFLGDNESVVSDSVAACLKDKEHLESLRLRWSSSPDNVDAINNAEMALDGSQPPKNLKVLEVYEYPGERFSNWLSFLTNLVRWDISFCGRCQYLPPLHRLSSLQQLRLVNLWALKYVSNVEWNMKSYNHLSTSPKSSTISFFPSLRTLHIKGCYNLRGWWPNQIWESNEVVGAKAEHQHQKPPFVKLSHLQISGCPNLTFMPPFPSVENLKLNFSSSMILQNTIMLKNVAATSERSTSPPLSKLKHLSIACVHDLESFPEAMDNLLCLQYLEFNNCSKLPSITEGIGKLVSLQSLGIIFCRSLASLSEGICNLTSLEHLKIINCPSLTSLPEGIGKLKSLQSLKIKDCTNLTSRLEGINSLTSLGDLTIAKCTSLTSLLEGIGSLSLLRVLSIDECSSLTSLPEEIGSLSSLTKLKIERCVNLISLSEGINNLSSLRELKIEGCTSLTSLSEGTSSLSSLKYLILKGCTSLTSIQERIACLPSLEDLTIVRCTSLTSLPEGISSLSLLRALTIQECSSLTSLPEGIGNLSSLRYLTIERCTSLTSIPHGICNLPSIKLVNGQRYYDMPLDGLVDYLLDAQKCCRIFPRCLYERRRCSESESSEDDLSIA